MEARYTAAFGGQDLPRLSKQDVCVILMDGKVMGLDGLETARLARARPHWRVTPTVRPSSHGVTDLYRARDGEAGAATKSA